MLKSSVPYSPNHILPVLAFGASHLPDSIWQGNPERKEIIYLAGKIVVIKQLSTQKTTLVKLSDNVKQVHFIGVSPDKKNIIVSETLSNDTALTLGIYSIADKTKRLFRIIMSHPENYFRLFDFAENMPNLVLLLTYTNEIYMVDLQKLRHVCYFNLQKFIPNSIKVCIDDSHLISICSRDSIRVYRLQEYTLKQMESVKGISGYKYTVQIWNTEGLFVGTEEGTILWLSYQNGGYELQSELSLDTSILHISQAGTNKLISVSDNGFVTLWEADYRNTKYGVGYEIIRTWKLPVGRVAGIKSMLATYRLQEIVFGFEDNYIGIVNVTDMYERGPAIQELEIDYLYKGSNSGGISSTDICIQRPIVVSVSKIDRSVRVYNYRMNRCDLVKYYTEKTDPQIECVSLHPLGYYIALGFANKLKIVHLLHNQLKDYRQILLKHVQYVKFSQSGAYLSVSCSKPGQQVSSWQLIILNSFTLQTIYSFIDWNSPIVSVRFCQNDSVFVAMCNGGSLRLCNIGSSVSSTKIASRSTKLYTSMAVYQPTDGIKHTQSLSVLSCSPHSKEGSTIRECKQVAKKYVQKFYDVREYNTTVLQIFKKASSEGFKLLAGCVEGIILLYNLPFDGIPLYIVNAHPSTISSFIMSPCESLLFSGCKEGILLCSEVQSWGDVSKSANAQCLEETLSDIMLINVLGMKDTEDKNKKLLTGMNQVEQRSKQVQKDLKGKFQQKLTQIIQQKNIQIEQLKQKFLNHLQQQKKIQQQHKQQINDIQNKNSQAASDLQVLFQRKIFLQAQQNVKLKHHIGKQQQKYKQKLQQLQAIHTENINTLTSEFNQMLSKTATLYRKETTKQKVSEKGYEEKLKIIDEEYQDEIQRLIEKHNLQEFNKTEIILKLNRQTDSLKSTIRGCNDQIVDKNREILKLKQEIEDLKFVSQVKQKDIKQLDTLLEQKQAFMTESKNKMSQIRERFKDTQRKKAILNVKAAQWRQAIQPREKQIEKLKNKLYELQGELDGLIRRQQTHLSAIQTLQTDKLKLTKTTKQQTIAIKSQENIVASILMDIKNILDKPKQSNRVYHQEIMLLFRKYNESGDRHLGGNTLEGIGEINRQVIHLEKVLDIKNKTSKKAMDQRNVQLNKKSVQNNQLIRDLNDYKIKYKQQGLELKGKQKIIDDLTYDLKQYSIRKTSRIGERTNDKNTDRTTKHQTNHQTPLGMSRSNSLRVHKLSKGSNFQPTLISNQKKEKLVELTSENELMRQYIVKLENREANFKEKVVRHMKICESGDRMLEDIVG